MAHYKKYKKLDKLYSDEKEELVKILDLLYSRENENRVLGYGLFLNTNFCKTLISDHVYIVDKSRGKSNTKNYDSAKYMLIESKNSLYIARLILYDLYYHSSFTYMFLIKKLGR